MNNLPQTFSNQQVSNKEQQLQSLSYLWNKLQDGRFVAVYRCLIDIAGNLKNAVYLSQFIYWQSRGTRLVHNNNFTLKTVKETEKETGLSQNDQRRCKEQLIEKGLIIAKTFPKTDAFGKKSFGTQLGVRVAIDELQYRLCQYFGIDPNSECNQMNIVDWKTGNHPVLRRMYSERFVYHRDLVYVTGDIYSAAMLSLYIRSCITKQKNYATFTIKDWQHILCIAEKRQHNIRNKLKSLDFITEKHLLPNSSRIFGVLNCENILQSLLESLNQIHDEKQHQSSQKLIEERLNQLINIDGEKGKNDAPKKVKMVNDGVLAPDVAKGRTESVSCGKTEKSSCGKRSNSLFKEITSFTDYNSYSPYTPPKTISVVFGGGVFSGHTFSANNIRQAENQKNTVIASSCREGLRPTENNETHSGCLNNKDMDKLIYPYCLRHQDNQPTKAIKQAIYNTVHTLLPNATVEEVQELLDEMAERANIANPLAYFQKLCRQKKDGMLILCNAPQIQDKRQRKTESRQAEKQEEQAEKLVSAMSDDELLAKYEYYKGSLIRSIEHSATQGFFVELFAGFIQEIAQEYLNRHHKIVADITELRTQIIERLGTKVSDKLQNIINTPEFGFSVCMNG